MRNSSNPSRVDETDEFMREYADENIDKEVLHEDVTSIKPASVCDGPKVFWIKLPKIFNFKVCEILYDDLNRVDDQCPQIHAFRRERLNSDEIPDSMAPYQEVLYDNSQFDVNSIINYRIEGSECRVFSKEEADLFYVEIFLGPIAGAVWKNPDMLTNNRKQWEMLFDYVYHVMRTGQAPVPELMNTLSDVSAIETDLRTIESLPNSTIWNRCHGCDHFMVSGRIGRDFQRVGGLVGDRHNKLLPVDKWKHVNFFSIEGSSPNNDRFPNFTGIPYPGHVHPSSVASLQNHIEELRTRKRKHMISLVGKDISGRHIAIRQCEALDDEVCKFMACTRKPNSPCIEHGSVKTLEVYADSLFCFQPHGDSPTRQGLFDSMSMGCIPVVPDSTSFSGYRLHIRDAEKFILIAYRPEDAIQKIKEMGEEGYRRMFHNLLKVLPNMIYAHQDTGFDDAISVMLKNLSCKAEIMKHGNGKTVSSPPSYC